MISGYEHLTVMTQDEVAAELGVSRQAVSNAERRAIAKLRLFAGRKLLAILEMMQELAPLRTGGKMTPRRGGGSLAGGRGYVLPVTSKHWSGGNTNVVRAVARAR